MKVPTLADARKLDLVPSVTNVISLLNKPELNNWKTEQAVLAVLSTPRADNEQLDEFVHRVLSVERVHEEEAKRAREIGTQIHDAIDKAITGMEYDRSLEAFVRPIVEWVKTTGRVVWTEKILVGDGFAGRADALLENELLNALMLVDFKTTSRIPKESYIEHRLQTAAYASTLGNTGNKRAVTCNVYISTKTPGDYSVSTQDDWPETFRNGFVKLLDFWQWSKGYWPTTSPGITP